MAEFIEVTNAATKYLLNVDHISETHVILPKKEYEDLKDAQRALDAVEEWLRSPMPDELPYRGSDGYRKAAMEVDEIISKAKAASPCGTRSSSRGG